MKLTRIRIRNLRCIENAEIFPRDYTSLIGPNNAGKSSVLRAIEIFLNQVKPSDDEWRQGHEGEPIDIEGDFENLEDWERNKPGVSSLVYNDKIQLRCRALLNEGGKVELSYEAKVPEESIDGWFDKWSDLDEEIKTLASEIGVSSAAQWRLKGKKESVKQLVRERLPDRVTVSGEPRWTSEGISINAALQQALPQAQVIPAVRDAGEDAKPGAKTSFGLLIKSIILPAVTGSEEFKALMGAVSNLEHRLTGDEGEQLPAIRDLAEAITQKLSSLITAKVTIGLDPPDANKFIGSNTTLRLDDGTDTRIALQGHGLQRALVFALLEVLAAQRATTEGTEDETPQTRCTVLLFEEPELFMHPHLMRRLKSTLQTISRRRDWQVLMSTHSPFLIDVGEDPCSLVIHRRSDASSPPTVQQLQNDPFSEVGTDEDRARLRAVLNFHPTVTEAFFAKHAVLVEGDSEIAALVGQPQLFELAGLTDAQRADVTLISCKGKWTIIPIALLLRAFGIPTRVIHDRDQKGKTLDELDTIPSHVFHANERIARALGNSDEIMVIDDTFEHVLWDRGDTPTSQKDKPHRAWKRVRELCENRSDLDHAPALKEVLAFAYRTFRTSAATNEK